MVATSNIRRACAVLFGVRALSLQRPSFLRRRSGTTSTMAAMAEKNDVEALMKGTEGAKAADYANYFSSYAYIYHQKQMLSDGARMRAYRDAILGNPASFKGKTVLDVGAGSGILSMWAAKAGAKRVIACEFTSMAAHAEKLVAANGLQHVVEVRRSAVETLDLAKGDVDVIVSEWMGFYLVHESNVSSNLIVRKTKEAKRTHPVL